MRHSFIMPMVNYFQFCKDYESIEGHHYFLDNEKILTNKLYYYVNSQLSNPFVELEDFENLQDLVLGVWIENIDDFYVDKEVDDNVQNDGLVIWVRDYNMDFFPVAGSIISLEVSGVVLSTKVCNCLFGDVEKAIKGLLLLPSSKTCIHDWFFSFFACPDVVEEENKNTLQWRTKGFSAFLRVNRQNEYYTLVADKLYLKELNDCGSYMLPDIW